MRDLDYTMINKHFNNIHNKLMIVVQTTMDEYDEDRLGTYLKCHTCIHSAYNSAFQLMEYYCVPELDYALSDRAEFLYRALSVVCNLEYRSLNRCYFERCIHYVGFVAELNDYMDMGITEKDANRIIYLLVQVYNNQFGKSLKKHLYPSDVIKVLTQDQPLFRYIYYSQKK